MEAAVIIGAEAPCITLFDVSAALPSVSWAWIEAVLDAVGVPPWVAYAVKGLT